ncbi:DNA-binding NarL/FixJ family response regulator [Streptohalobacillus salinus]|uniref:DNA-binding NarL/FixJ family response regulator n=1 Tax=Streptohalobacillus salinus TaxID=621096 RepID=A0A2V3WC80_9BACI|nr:response regulator transcription factor [Streptohalobacillus salinus]PXW92175.1 DNA-binding NarL/FixJ family response regulator [Streptohalobacillus salinus]
MKCLFIKKPSLLRDGIAELLKRRFSDSQITCREDFSFQEAKEASLIIIETSEALTCKEQLETIQSEGVKIVLWVEDLDKKQAAPLFKLGLYGYLYYNIDEETLIQALRFVLDGKRYVSPILGGMLIEVYCDQDKKQMRPPLELLSRREWEVLQLLVKGYSNIKIADALFLSDKTVKNYVSSILHKLNVPDRTNAVLKALKKQWLYL